MSPKVLTPAKTKKGKSNYDQLIAKGKTRKGVQSLSQFVPENQFTSLADLDGQTIFVVAVRPIKSAEYGDGFHLQYKESSKAKETLSTATFSKVAVPILTTLYENSHQGRMISLDSPVKITVEVKGKAIILR